MRDSSTMVGMTKKGGILRQAQDAKKIAITKILRSAQNDSENG